MSLQYGWPPLPRDKAVEVILGGTPDAAYPINVTAGDFDNMSAMFHLYSNRLHTSVPSVYLAVIYLYDALGTRLNACKAGDTCLIYTKCYMPEYSDNGIPEDEGDDRWEIRPF